LAKIGRGSSPNWALALLTGIAICGFIDRIIMQVLVQPIKTEFGLTDLQIGLVSGLAFAVLNVVLGLWVARIAERRRRTPLVWIGTILWSIATAACGAAANFIQLIFARVGVGVGEAVGLPATSSIVSDYFPKEKRTTAMAVLMLAPPLGAFIGSAGAATIAQTHGWREAFYVAAIPGFLLALLFALTVDEPKRGQHDGLTEDSAVPPFSAVMGRLFGRRSLTHLLAGSTIASMAGFALNAFLAAWLLRRFGFGVAQAGIIAGLIASLPASFSVLGAGWLADRMGKRNPAAYGLIPAISLIIAAPLYILAVTRDEPVIAIVLLGLSALVQYTYLAPTLGVFQNMMHPRMRASSSAFNNMIYSLVGGGLGPLVIGALSDRLAPDTTQLGSAIGLGHAMAAMACLYLWAAVHFLIAARALPREFHLPID